MKILFVAAFGLCVLLLADAAIFRRSEENSDEKDEEKEELQILEMSKEQAKKFCEKEGLDDWNGFFCDFLKKFDEEVPEALQDKVKQALEKMITEHNFDQCFAEKEKGSEDAISYACKMGQMLKEMYEEFMIKMQIKAEAEKMWSLIEQTLAKNDYNIEKVCKARGNKVAVFICDHKEMIVALLELHKKITMEVEEKMRRACTELSTEKKELGEELAHRCAMLAADKCGMIPNKRGEDEPLSAHVIKYIECRFGQYKDPRMAPTEVCSHCDTIKEAVKQGAPMSQYCPQVQGITENPCDKEGDKEPERRAVDKLLSYLETIINKNKNLN